MAQWFDAVSYFPSHLCGTKDERDDDSQLIKNSLDANPSTRWIIDEMEHAARSTYLPYKCWEARNQCQVKIFCALGGTNSQGQKYGIASCIWMNCDPNGRSGGHCKGSGSSCFIPSARVTMADGSLRCIADVKQGDMVMSGRTGRPTRVVYRDSQYGGRHIWGFGGRAPFATVDHCFFDGSNRESSTRLVLHSELSRTNRWFDDIESLRPAKRQSLRAVRRDGTMGTEPLTNDVVMARLSGQARVLDLVTEDHSYVVEGLAVHDDMPEVEKNPVAALFCDDVVNWLMQQKLEKVFGAGKA